LRRSGRNEKGRWGREEDVLRGIRSTKKNDRRGGVCRRKNEEEKR
jgi:hypothetical protein